MGAREILFWLLVITDTVGDRNWWLSSPGGCSGGAQALGVGWGGRQALGGRRLGESDRWWGHRPWGGDR